MKYLLFDKKELVNLEYSLNREILSTNRAGGYLSTTIVLCNTRKYHGLMVLPLDQFDGEPHVLLSSVDDTIVQHGQSFNLGIHRYPGIYEPRGHKYIIDFDYEPTPTITYRVGGIAICS
jgi:predicted glycogen debranching enzyme